MSVHRAASGAAFSITTCAVGRWPWSLFLQKIRRARHRWKTLAPASRQAGLTHFGRRPGNQRVHRGGGAHDWPPVPASPEPTEPRARRSENGRSDDVPAGHELFAAIAWGDQVAHAGRWDHGSPMHFYAALLACDDGDVIIGGWGRHPESPGVARIPPRDDHPDLRQAADRDRGGREPRRADLTITRGGTSMKCPECGGRGETQFESAIFPQTCELCEGTGAVEHLRTPYKELCTACDGSGRVVRFVPDCFYPSGKPCSSQKMILACDICDGKGYRRVNGSPASSGCLAILVATASGIASLV